MNNSMNLALPQGLLWKELWNNLLEKLFNNSKKANDFILKAEGDGDGDSKRSKNTQVSKEKGGDNDDPTVGQHESLGPLFVFVNQFNPLKDFVPNTNPNGVWLFGYGTVGGDFTPCGNMTIRETAYIWNSNEGWKGIFLNPASGRDIPLSQGLVLKPNTILMHPGNKTDHLSKIKFTAPEDGQYTFDVKWTAADEQAKKTWTWVYTNAGGTIKELFTQGIEGYNASSSLRKSIDMKAGEFLSFEMGNGGDQYFDDALSIELTIDQTRQVN